MSIFAKVVGFTEAHPVEVGVGVFGVGLLFLFATGAFSGGGGGSQAAQGSDVSSYFAAEAAQGEAGDALQATQINAQASTTQALAADSAAQNIQSTWAATDLSETNSTNTANVQLAPFAAQVSIAGDVASAAVANSTPLTTTYQSSSANSGFFGIGASQSSTTGQKQTSNPVGAAATQELEGLFSSGFGSNGHN